MKGTYAAISRSVLVPHSINFLHLRNFSFSLFSLPFSITFTHVFFSLSLFCTDKNEWMQRQGLPHALFSLHSLLLIYFLSLPFFPYLLCLFFSHLSRTDNKEHLHLAVFRPVPVLLSTILLPLFFLTHSTSCYSAIFPAQTKRNTCIWLQTCPSAPLYYSTSSILTFLLLVLSLVLAFILLPSFQ